jgi:selenocysteine lyase/cysteine desulfurase
VLKHRFERFLAPDRLHFAAHSHHLWPDVTLEAHSRAWHDAARLVDAKWDLVFGELLAASRGHVARLLGLPDPGTVAFAPNTHEFVVRLASCLPTPFSVVTSDAEFHSFRRQLARWEEAGMASAVRIPAEPFPTFPDRFAAAVEDAAPDLVYLSHVFYDSGYVVPDLGRIAAATPEETFVVFDGYHAFMALPVDLEALADRVFYLGGGYKYAMAGEGACFLHCPPGYGSRPVATGWMAAFGALTAAAGEVGYGADGSRFFGATFDPSPFYRFNAVQDMLRDEDVGVDLIHAHVRRLQRRLVEGLPGGTLAAQAIIPAWDPEGARGNFLTFRTPEAGAQRTQLRARGVITDVRGDRLRFGFGVYHDEGDVDRLLAVVGEIG